MSFYVRLMKKGDIGQVTEIDREAFPTMFPPANFQRELNSPLAYYIVACGKESRPTPTAIAEKNRNKEKYIAGFAGFWLMAGEAHIVNFAVRQSHQRQGVGELLLIYLLELAMKMNASLITLEVRKSNVAARKLYDKYGFTDRGLRKRYYTDNREDAVIMTVDDIKSPIYQLCLKQLKQDYFKRRGTSLHHIIR